MFFKGKSSKEKPSFSPLILENVNENTYFNHHEKAKTLLLSKCHELNFWNPYNGKYLTSKPLPSQFQYEPSFIQSINCQISKNRVAIGDASGKIYLVNIIKELFRKPVVLSKHKSTISALSTNYNNNNNNIPKILVSGSFDKSIIIWDVKSGKDKHRFKNIHSSHIKETHFLNFYGYKKFVSGSYDWKVKLFDVEKVKCTKVFKNHKNCVNAVCSYDKFVWSCSDDESVKSVSLVDHKVINNMKFNEAIVSVECFDAESNYLVLSGGKSGVVYCNDIRKYSETLWEKKIHEKEVCRIINLKSNLNYVKLNHQLMISCSRDNHIIVFDVKKGGKIVNRMKEKEQVHGICLFNNNYFEEIEELPFLKNLPLIISNNLLNKKKSLKLLEKVKSQKRVLVDSPTFRSIEDPMSLILMKLRILRKVLRIEKNRIRQTLKAFVRLKHIHELGNIIIETFERILWKNNEVRLQIIKEMNTFFGKSSEEYQDFLEIIDSASKYKSKVITKKFAFNKHWKFLLPDISVFKHFDYVELESFGKDQKMIYVGEVDYKEKTPSGFGFIILEISNVGRFYNTTTYTKIFEGNFWKGKKFHLGREYSSKNDTLGNLLFEGNYYDSVRNGEGFEFSNDKKGDITKIKEVLYVDDKVDRVVGDHDFVMIKRDLGEKSLRKNKIIGSSSYGKVYKIELNNKKYALKVIRFYSSFLLEESEENYEYLIKTTSTTRRYITSLCKLNHKNIIRTYGIIEDKNDFGLYKGIGILMEYGKCSLEKFIQDCLHNNTKIKFSKKVEMLYEILCGIQYIRDSLKLKFYKELTLRNILVGKDGLNIKISSDFQDNESSIIKYLSTYDFGFSLFSCPVALSSKRSKKRLSKKHDVYSFGLISFCLIFERVNPFSSNYFENYKCSCGEFVNRILPKEIFSHIKNCCLRPLITEFFIRKIMGEIENEMADFFWVVLRIMRLCWSEILEQRPSFREVLRVFENFIQKEKNLTYAFLFYRMKDSDEKVYECLITKLTYSEIVKKARNILGEGNELKIRSILLEVNKKHMKLDESTENIEEFLLNGGNSKSIIVDVEKDTSVSLLKKENYESVILENKLLKERIKELEKKLLEKKEIN